MIFDECAVCHGRKVVVKARHRDDSVIRVVVCENCDGGLFAALFAKMEGMKHGQEQRPT